MDELERKRAERYGLPSDGSLPTTEQERAIYAELCGRALAQIASGQTRQSRRTAFKDLTDAYLSSQPGCMVYRESSPVPIGMLTEQDENIFGAVSVAEIYSRSGPWRRLRALGEVGSVAVRLFTYDDEHREHMVRVGTALELDGEINVNVVGMPASPQLEDRLEAISMLLERIEFAYDG